MKWLLKNSRFIFLILAILLAMPLPVSFIGGLLWFSPFLFLNTVLASKTFVLLNLIGLTVLILIVFKKRFVCQYMCPLGIVCDQVSNIPVRKRKLPIPQNFNKGLALFTLTYAIFGLPVFAILDPFYIFQISFEPIRTGVNAASLLKLFPLLSIIGINLFFPNSWCANICPLGGLQLLVVDLKDRVARKRKPMQKDGRRLFISGLAGLTFGLLTPSLLKKERKTIAIKPPSSLPENDYSLTCIRCGNCISACPTNILYQQSGVNLMGFLTPGVDFSESYCLPDCKLCGDVCPSGALKKFTLEEKKNLHMASVSIEHELCLLYKQKECNQCRQFCDYDAISYQIADSLLTPSPIIDKDKCVGCAACKIVCPEDAIYINPEIG